MITRVFTIALCSGALSAQVATEATPPPLTSTASVDRMCEKMLAVAGLQFATSETQDDSMTRRFRGMMPGGDGVDVEGTWCANVTEASLNDQRDQVVMHHGQMIAKHEDGDWKRRHLSLAGGQPLPFVFNPQRFFSALAELPPEARGSKHVEKIDYRGTPVEIVSLSLEGDAALDFQHSGAIPALKGGGAVMILGGAGGMFDGLPPPDITIDLALYLDPESGHVLRAKAKSYKTSNMPGGIVIEGMGDDEEEEPEEEVEEFDANGDRIYKRGLPARKVGEDVSVLEYDVRLSEHGKTFVPDIDPAARRVLGMK